MKSREDVTGSVQTIDLIGTCESNRFLVEVNGSPVRLTGKAFLYLFKLAWARTYVSDGWIYKNKLDAGENQARYLYRLKSEITEQGFNAEKLIENDRKGYYRLSIPSIGIDFDAAGLSKFPDVQVSECFSKIVQS